ncbi:TM0106 family RecB-like putative nuclease [Micropruina sp.]|uniref:TM0106 family RecB-like putative nuclease n=1 Tax=Micropruina sp. TaxID=2737536 RepID=UPI0039E6A47D
MFTLDAYAARSCPVKTHNAFHPGLSVPTRAEEGLREVFHGGVAFQAEVLRELIGGFTGSVFDARDLTDLPAAEQQQLALAAMAEGVQVLIAPLLPSDYEQHRRGRPDLLLRADDGGYHPAEIKFHRVSDPRREPATLTWSSLTDPLARNELPGRRFRHTWRLNDLLQLAHYHRMLQHIGRASARPLAAVVGTDELDGLGRVLSWVDLGLPVVPPSPRDRLDPDDVEHVSALERYDGEHAFRVELAQAASALSPDDPPLLEPIANRECGWCQWWDVCRPQLSDDDLSLRISKSPLDVHEIQVLRDVGVSTVTELAARDVDALLPDYLPRVTHRVGAEDRLRLAWRRSVLMARGVDFDRVTQGPIAVPSATVEIDLDVETSVGDRVYLWGFLVSDARDGSRHYRHFSAFDELDDASEQALAEQAMTWLRTLTDGVDALVVHYSDYEVVRLQRLAQRSGSPVLAWALDWAQRHFFDLFTVIRTHFFGTQGLGLKVVASKAAGFAWRDATPGGLNSQAWYEEAVSGASPELRASARQRVLEYNEDDVEATWHVRRWLRTLG